MGDGSSSSVQRLSDYVVRNHSQEWDVLDAAQFRDGDMDSLMDLGYVYSDIRKGKQEYVLAVMPEVDE